jgi:hypothetical protein
MAEDKTVNLSRIPFKEWSTWTVAEQHRFLWGFQMATYGYSILLYELGYQSAKKVDETLRRILELSTYQMYDKMKQLERSKVYADTPLWVIIYQIPQIFEGGQNGNKGRN